MPTPCLPQQIPLRLAAPFLVTLLQLASSQVCPFAGQCTPGEGVSSCNVGFSCEVQCALGYPSYGGFLFSTGAGTFNSTACTCSNGTVSVCCPNLNDTSGRPCPVPGTAAPSTGVTGSGPGTLIGPNGGSLATAPVSPGGASSSGSPSNSPPAGSPGPTCAQPIAESPRLSLPVLPRPPGPAVLGDVVITKVAATFCIGPAYRDGLDGSFCSTPYEPPTNVTLYLDISDQPLPNLFGVGPWDDGKTYTLMQDGLSVPVRPDGLLRAAMKVAAAGNDELVYTLSVALTYADGSRSPAFCWTRQRCGLSSTSCVNCVCTLTSTSCDLPGAYSLGSTPCQSCGTCVASSA